jgi:hypothetical protein
MYGGNWSGPWWLTASKQPRCAAEQREIDRVNAEIVAVIAQFGRSLIRSWHSLRHVLRVRRGAQLQLAAADEATANQVECYAAAPWPGCGTCRVS